jgi:putative Holliday junction resolvase
MATQPLKRNRRIIAFDPGERRVGVAVSDELHLIASPVSIVDLKRGGWEELDKIIEMYDPELIVVGIPTSLSGREGPQARAARRFADEVRKRSGRQTHFQDERLTSFMAEQSLIELGKNRKDRKRHLDAVAAALILQSFLDARRG